ncbi:hypothetical protein [Chitinimonas lacunae]|uniref:Tetratricopeptide repeat protein n=1 Tax=Chitinimonas lacunae TaxID=1963018 RepID=A0ABV8MR11_9NEIS
METRHAPTALGFVAQHGDLEAAFAATRAQLAELHVDMDVGLSRSQEISAEMLARLAALQERQGDLEGAYRSIRAAALWGQREEEYVFQAGRLAIACGRYEEAGLLWNRNAISQFSSATCARIGAACRQFMAEHADETGAAFTLARICRDVLRGASLGGQSLMSALRPNRRDDGQNESLAC